MILDPNVFPPIRLREDFNTNVIFSVGSDSSENFMHMLKLTFPQVFCKTLGCLRDYVHHIRLVEGAKSVCSKVCNVPVAVREQVQSELELLKADGIIEEVEATPWLTPVVAAKKADGSLCLCVDLRELN